MLRDCAMRAWFLAAFLPVVACGSSTEMVGPSTGGSAPGSGGASGANTGGSSAGGFSEGGVMESLDAALGTTDAATHCDALVEMHPIEGAAHTPNFCDPTNYLTNPPSSGNHYANWALYQTYTQTFRPGFWVHNLEHGAVVFTYNCPDGCADDVARIQALIDSLPNDCSGTKRYVLLPDPDLDVRFAASAWGFTIKAPCFDRDAFAQFVADHYSHGPELICGGGLDPVGVCP